MKCACCDAEGVLYLHSKCHMNVPTWAALHPDGLLTIMCAECEKIIVQFDVKERKAVEGK